MLQSPVTILSTPFRRKISPRSCSKKIIPATHNPSSFHRQSSTQTPRALAPTTQTQKSISSPLLRPSSAIIASQRSEAISRHLSTAPSSSPVNMSYSKQPSEFQPRKVGALHTSEYRCYIEDKSGTPVSPFHDIPLYANEQQTVLNMVVEIPRWSNAKLEVGPLLISVRPKSTH